MARVPYVDADADATPELAELYAGIGALRGSVLNLYRALGNQPAALRAFMAMSRYVRDDAALPANLRELAILATGYALDVAYEQYHHIPAARRAGVTEEQLAAFPDWAESTAFDETERVVLAYADRVARTRDVDDATFAAVRDRLPLPQVIDLVVTCAWYHFCAAIVVPLGIETEGPRDGH